MKSQAYKDSNIKVKLGMPVYAYENGINFTNGRYARLVGLVHPELRKDKKIIVVTDEETGNVRRVEKVERVNRQRTETWPISHGEIVDAINTPDFNLENTSDCSHELSCDEQEEVVAKPVVRPNNKPAEIKAYVTTNGEIHTSEADATESQLELDVLDWLMSERCINKNLLQNGGRDVAKFFKANKTDIAAFLRRIKVEKPDEK